MDRSLSSRTPIRQDAIMNIKLTIIRIRIKQHRAYVHITQSNLATLQLSVSLVAVRQSNKPNSQSQIATLDS